MLNREELKDIAKMHGDGAFFVNVFLNVNPMTSVKNNFEIHLKSMIKKTSGELDKAVLKKVSSDFEKIDSYVLTNKRMFKKGLAIICSQEKQFWKEYHLSVPLKNELIVDNTPYIKPLIGVLDNYQRYAIMLVGKDLARLFLVHLGEIEEYSEVHSEGVPGKHKKGGWFALAEKSYERHIDYHVGLHLKDVVKKLDAFLSGEYVGRLIIGGSEEAVVRVKDMLPQTVAEKVIGTFQAEMIANNNEVLEKVQPILRAFEVNEDAETVDDLLTRSMKKENAVIGIEDVLNALQEGRVMKLVFLKDFKRSGLSCRKCGYLTVQNITQCPYCKGDIKKVKYIVDLIAQKAVEQGAVIKVLSENAQLKEAGNIGSLLRF